MKRIVVGITGATGAVFGVRLLEALRAAEVETHLVLSKWGLQTVEHELGLSLTELRDRATVVHGGNNMAATISSGSFRTEGMVIAPCSMRTAGAIAHGYGESLVHRAADVVLKERRRLVLVPRETPLSIVHLQNMLELARLGAIMLPAMPGFYHRPASVQDMVDFVVGKILDRLRVEHALVRRWSTPPTTAASPWDEGEVP